jgi:hypothetical protein
MITIRLLKPLKNKIITFQANVIQRDADYILVRAQWNHPLVDMGYVTFAPGDYLYEHFYRDRWYNVYELRSQDGVLKGWYCNITRPAVFFDGVIESEDLEIDLFVPPDRANILVLDEDEYAARGLTVNEPEAHEAVVAALAELRDLAGRGVAPFCADLTPGLRDE